MSFREWMEKQAVEGPCEERTMVLICTANLDESQRHGAEWKKPVSKDYIPTLAEEN